MRRITVSVPSVCLQCSNAWKPWLASSFSVCRYIFRIFKFVCQNRRVKVKVTDAKNVSVYSLRGWTGLLCVRLKGSLVRCCIQQRFYGEWVIWQLWQHSWPGVYPLIWIWNIVDKLPIFPNPPSLKLQTPTMLRHLVSFIFTTGG